MRDQAEICRRKWAILCRAGMGDQLRPGPVNCARVKKNRSVLQILFKSICLRIIGASIREKEAFPQMFVGKAVNDFLSCSDGLFPCSTQGSRRGGGIRKCQKVEFCLGKSQTGCIRQQGNRVDSGILSACGPGQVTERLEETMTRDHVNPVPWLKAAGESQHLVGGEVEGMHCQSEEVVLHKGKKPEGAVSKPLDENPIVFLSQIGFHKRRNLPKQFDGVSCPFQEGTVTGPGGMQSFGRIMKKIDVPGKARRSQSLIQGHSPRNVTYAVFLAAVGQKAKKGYLKCCKRHAFNFRTSNQVTRSQFWAMESRMSRD